MTAYCGTKIDILSLIRLGNVVNKDEVLFILPISYQGEKIKLGNEPILKSKYKIIGMVTESTVPVIRTLRLYRESTGELIDESLSLMNGTYELKTPYNDNHYVVCMDVPGGNSYNHLIRKDVDIVVI
jgi:hypothetical protein